MFTQVISNMKSNLRFLHFVYTRWAINQQNKMLAFLCFVSHFKIKYCRGTYSLYAMSVAENGSTKRCFHLKAKSILLKEKYFMTSKFFYTARATECCTYYALATM